MAINQTAGQIYCINTLDLIDSNFFGNAVD